MNHLGHSTQINKDNYQAAPGVMYINDILSIIDPKGVNLFIFFSNIIIIKF